LKIAVVGGGISGLAAAHLLGRRHQVRLFEAGPTLGGHTHTVTVRDGERELPIDMGFIVFNRRTYPYFCRLLDELGVASDESDMSLSVRSTTGGLEYNPSSLPQLFAQRRNLVSPSFHRLVLGILRFQRLARRLLADGGGEGMALKEFVTRHRLGRPVVERYLVPMAAAIWSAVPRRILEFPVRTLAAFLHNHGLLQVAGRPVWRVIRGGSKRYVEALAARQEPGAWVTGAAVERVRRNGAGVEVKLAGGESTRFDHVVLATHSDQALALLDDPTPAERRLLGAIAYQPNEVVLHTDPRLMPRRRLAWASWNVQIGDGQQGEDTPVRVSYWMNRLQNLEAEQSYLVSLNAGGDVDPAAVVARRTFSHPVYTADAVAAQRQWRDISGPEHRISYCGAYWGFGFHEDGMASAVRVARALGAEW
jgi:predicted NAD/FAD-binding protein